GCLLAYASRHTTSAARIARWALITGGLLIAVQLVATRVGEPAPLHFAMWTLGWRVLCLSIVYHASRAAGQGVFSRLIRARPLVYVGTISYAMYLVHMFVMPTVQLVQNKLGINLLPLYSSGHRQFVTVSVLSIAAASVSWV